TRWSPSPVTRPAHTPSTMARPSSSRPSSAKKEIAASRDSTTMPTVSIRLSAMFPLYNMSSVLSTNSDQEVPPTIGCYAAITLYLDVLPTLSLLKDTYRLGLATNGNTYPEPWGLPGLR